MFHASPLIFLSALTPSSAFTARQLLRRGRECWGFRALSLSLGMAAWRIPGLSMLGSVLPVFGAAVFGTLHVGPPSRVMRLMLGAGPFGAFRALSVLGDRGKDSPHRDLDPSREGIRRVRKSGTRAKHATPSAEDRTAQLGPRSRGCQSRRVRETCRCTNTALRRQDRKAGEGRCAERMGTKRTT